MIGDGQEFTNYELLLKLHAKKNLTDEEQDALNLLLELKEIIDHSDRRIKEVYYKSGLRRAPMYYDPDGNPCSQWEWQHHRQKVKEFSWQDKVNQYLVSTTYIGLSDEHGNSAPLIYETMVFDQGDDPYSDRPWNDLFCERYSTLEQAREGHLNAVAMIHTRRFKEILDGLD